MRNEIQRTLYIAGGMLVTGGFVWAFVAHPPSDSGHWASWVQAAGSIAAIIGAVAIAFWQYGKELTRARAADLEIRGRRLRVYVELVRATAHHARWVQEQLPNREAVNAVGERRRPLDEHHVSRLGLLLEAIPLHEMDDEVFVNEILIATESARNVRSSVQVALQHCRGMNGGDFQQFFRTLELGAASCERCHATLRDRASHLLG